MANSFSHIGTACVRVLARQAAINLVKSELQRQGLRVAHVPSRDIQLRADELLRQRPELIAQAAERIAREPERWLPKRARLSVSATEGRAESAIVSMGAQLPSSASASAGFP